MIRGRTFNIIIAGMLFMLFACVVTFAVLYAYFWETENAKYTLLPSGEYRYTSETAGMAITLPERWGTFISENSDIAYTMKFSHPFTTVYSVETGDDHPVNIVYSRVYRYPSGEEIVAAGDYTKSQREGYDRLRDVQELIEVDEVTIGPWPATVFYVKDVETGTFFAMIIIDSTDGVHLFLAPYTEEHKAEYVETLYDVVSSFEIVRDGRE